MTDHALVLNLSEELYDYMRELAEESNRPVEELAMETLHLAFQQDARLPEVDDLDTYTDAQLWIIVHRRLNWAQSLRLRELIAKAQAETITEAEQEEANYLVERNDELMLLRSQALLLLKQRGHDISDYLKTE